MKPGLIAYKAESHYWSPDQALKHAEEIEADATLPELNDAANVKKAESKMWLALDTSYWLREHSLRGTLKDSQASVAGDVCMAGLGIANKIARDLPVWNFKAHQAKIVVAAAGTYQWLSSDRSLDYYDLVEIEAQRVRNSIVDSAKSLGSLVDNAKNRTEESRYQTLYGLLFELVTASMVLENERFKNNGIFPVPAGPSYEHKTDKNRSPSDLLLMQHHPLSDRAFPIAGIQCKGSYAPYPSNPENVDPAVFTFRASQVIAQIVGDERDFKPRVAVDAWVDEAKRRAMQARFMGLIAVNQSCTLKDILSMESPQIAPYTRVQPKKLAPEAPPT